MIAAPDFIEKQSIDDPFLYVIVNVTTPQDMQSVVTGGSYVFEPLWMDVGAAMAAMGGHQTKTV
jgi:hypothetical protein